MATASQDSLVNVILEEIGHFVDAQVNSVDSAGDEGAIFAALVQGDSLSISTLQALRDEDDHATITVNGQIIQVEQQNFTGTDGNDTITGTIADDFIEGKGGNDILNGGAGKDTLSYSGTTASVTVNFANGSASISSNTQTLSNFEVVLGATNFANQLTGGVNADSLLGGNLDDILSGGAGNDSLTGNGGNDILVGGSGTDTLIGGTRADRFTFNNLTDNSDNITDFTVSQSDQIVVSAAGFKGGLMTGVPLSSAQLVLGTAATQGIGQFIYNISTGKLLFDVDGTGSGAATQIAIFASTTKPILGTSSFAVIA